jgi:histidinol-phosphatase (PHP family)
MKLYDYHIHTNCSPDASDSMPDVCRFAYMHNFDEIAITDHCEANANNSSWGDNALDRNFRFMTIAKEEFEDRISIKIGIELGQAMQNLTLSDRVLSKYQFDVVLGSLHNIAGESDFAYIKFDKYDLDVLVHQYFIEILDLVNWNKTDVLTHLTYPLRYLSSKTKFDLLKHKDIIAEILTKLAQNGKALEINTSGLRQRYGKTLPEMWVVKLFRDLGGEYITIGSDAHCIKHLGNGVFEGMKIAKEAGFNYIASYEKRIPTLVSIE